MRKQLPNTLGRLDEIRVIFDRHTCEPEVTTVTHPPRFPLTGYLPNPQHPRRG